MADTRWCTALVLLLPAACAAPPHAATPPREANNFQEPVLREAARRPLRSIEAAVWSLGRVPCDRFALPLVSPDGRHLATEVGEAPGWDASLAQPRGGVPQGTSIEIWSLDPQRATVGRTARLPGGLLLGRSADATGFLVESPRPDGSRWIGRVDWATGTLAWLVADDAVNAFASLGPGNRLAWSRRDPETGRFDLVVRSPSGAWSPPEGSEDWLHPVWDDDGGGLFALALHGGVLDLVHMEIASSDASATTPRTNPIAGYATIQTAYQVLNAQQVGPGPPGVEPELFFHHPVQQRVARWRPGAPAGDTMDLLPPGSLAAVPDGRGGLFVTTEHRLAYLAGVNAGNGTTILNRLAVPRRTSNPACPFLLLAPDGETVEVLGMVLLDPDPPTGLTTGR